MAALTGVRIPCRKGPRKFTLWPVPRTAYRNSHTSRFALGEKTSFFQSGFHSCRKRGEILEQRRRLTVKFQSHFALWHVVAMRLTSPRSSADRCLLRGRNPSPLLRKGCTSRFVNRNWGIRVQKEELQPELIRIRSTAAVDCSLIRKAQRELGIKKK